MIKAILVGIVCIALICLISIAYSCFIVSSYCSRDEEYLDEIDEDEENENNY